MTCQAVWYDHADVVEVRDGRTVHRARVVAVPCTAPKMASSPWQPASYCATHARQLALAAEAGLAVPEPPPVAALAEEVRGAQLPGV